LLVFLFKIDIKMQGSQTSSIL